MNRREVMIASIAAVAGLIGLSTHDKLREVHLIPIGGPPKKIRMINIKTGDQFTISDVEYGCEYDKKRVYTAQKDAFYNQDGVVAVVAI